MKRADPGRNLGILRKRRARDRASGTLRKRRAGEPAIRVLRSGRAGEPTTPNLAKSTVRKADHAESCEKMTVRGATPARPSSG
ncbi:MAG: hypothetical protein C6W57_03890 [Caldibacillus debilis]|nr:MAG: hypothetical protein C6W57_03890 [Caldibacillus debilis]